MFQTFILNPLLSVLLFIYQNLSFGDFGIAVILLTLFIRIILFPLFYKGAKDQAVMQKIQPEIKRIQKEEKGNMETQGRLLMELYKKNKLNPFSSIFILIIQLPIFFALFKIFSTSILNGQFDNVTLFGLINLKESGLDLAICAAIFQYIQLKISLPKDTSGAPGFQKALLYIVPILTIGILMSLPRALGLYWVFMTIFSILQQWYINKKVVIQN